VYNLATKKADTNSCARFLPTCAPANSEVGFVERMTMNPRNFYRITEVT
jgi:hypothetical protein